MVAIRKIIAYGQNSNIKLADHVLYSETIYEHIKHLPSDLLYEAVLGITGTWRWGNRMPTAAEILDPVSEKMMRRTIARGQISLALQRVPPEKTGPFVEQSKIDAVMANHRKWVADRSIGKFKTKGR